MQVGNEISNLSLLQSYRQLKVYPRRAQRGLVDADTIHSLSFLASPTTSFPGLKPSRDSLVRPSRYAFRILMVISTGKQPRCLDPPGSVVRLKIKEKAGLELRG